jgi:prefoldin subunit 5
VHTLHPSPWPVFFLCDSFATVNLGANLAARRFRGVTWERLQKARAELEELERQAEGVGTSEFQAELREEFKEIRELLDELRMQYN